MANGRDCTPGWYLATCPIQLKRMKKWERWSFPGWQSFYKRKPERLRNKGILHVNWLHSIWGAKRTLFVLLWGWKWNVNPFSAQVTLLAIELYSGIGLCGSNPAADPGRGGNAALRSFSKRLSKDHSGLCLWKPHGRPTFHWGMCASNSGSSLSHWEVSKIRNP